MTASRATGVLAEPLRVLWGIGVVGGLSDGQLIDGIASGDGETVELSFQTLIGRHGPMVLRVCQRMLIDSNDAEDAFQATFLVLLRRAHRIRDRRSVAGWLHGVAARIAARATVEAARRRRIERRGIRTAVERDSSADRLELESLIQDELARLPEKYRAPIVLCYFEGLTHEGAADQLGWRVGTVRGRLARARDRLRARLTRRGVPATAVLGALESSGDSAFAAAIPAALRDATVQTVVRVASGQRVAVVACTRIAAWAEDASRLISLSRCQTVAGLLLTIAVVGTAMGLAVPAASLLLPQTSEARRTPQPLSQEDRAENRREMLQLKGTWSSPQTITSALDGVPQPPKTYKLIWSIDRDTITTTNEDGFVDHVYRFTIDPDRTPKEIDLELLDLDLSLRGIYKLEGDTLTICQGLERPKVFGDGPGHFQIVFQRKDRSPAQLVPEYPNAPGCYWAVQPMTGLPRSMASGGINLIIKKDPDGALLISVASIVRIRSGEPDREYRPVAFDDKKTRYLFAADRGGGSSSSSSFPGLMLAHNDYRLDPGQLGFDGVKALGIEVVPAEVRQRAAEAKSASALREARAAGIEILPLPEVGKPFAFNLTASNGRVQSTAALKGKVVLIDCWAQYRSPCMGKMDLIKTVYERRRGDGFEVVGVNLDRDRGKAEQLAKTLALPWPQVFVPGDDRTRQLWADGPGIAHPHLLLIDREGILRWNGGPEELEEQLAALLHPPGARK